MGNPAFWFYPKTSTGAVYKLGLPAVLSEFFWTPIRDRRSGWTLDGRQQSLVNSGRHRVTITLGPFNDSGIHADLWWKFETMSAHLERGGAVSFAYDEDKAWASFVTSRSGSTLNVMSNVFGAYNAAATLVNGDVVCIESPNPELKREYVKVSSLAGSVMTTGSPPIYSYAEAPLMVRHEGFYPVLFLAESELGKSLVTSDHRITFTFDVTLDQSVGGFAAFYDDPDNEGFIELEPDEGGDFPYGDETIEGVTGWTLDRVVKAGPWTSGGKGTGNRDLPDDLYVYDPDISV